MKKYAFIFLFFLVGITLGVVGGFKISKISLEGVSTGYIGMGQQNLKEKDYMRAIAYFNKAIALDQNSFMAHIALADAYYSINNFDLALEEYEVTLHLWDEKGGTKYIKDRIEELQNKKGKK